METRLEPTGEMPLLPAAVKAGSAEGKQKAFWGSGSSLGVSLVKTVHIAEGHPRVFYTGAFRVTTLCCSLQCPRGQSSEQHSRPAWPGPSLPLPPQSCSSQPLIPRSLCAFTFAFPQEAFTDSPGCLGRFRCIPTAPCAWCTQGEGLHLPLFLKLRSFSAFL